jgi:hypothetical protein
MDATIRDRIAEMLRAGHDPAAISTILLCRFADVIAVRIELQAEKKHAIRERMAKAVKCIGPEVIGQRTAKIRAEWQELCEGGREGRRQPARDWSRMGVRQAKVVVLSPRHYGFNKGLDN